MLCPKVLSCSSKCLWSLAMIDTIKLQGDTQDSTSMDMHMSFPFCFDSNSWNFRSCLSYSDGFLFLVLFYL